VSIYIYIYISFICFIYVLMPSSKFNNDNFGFVLVQIDTEFVEILAFRFEVFLLLEET